MRPAGLPGVEFGSEPLQLSCWSCHRQIVTDVTSEMTSSGMCFALCRALIGEGEPSHSGKHIALIIFVTILVL